MAYFNGSADGHAKGYQDGLAGRSKQSIGTLREALRHAIRPESYTDSFIDGYNQGWTEGNRKRNGV